MLSLISRLMETLRFLNKNLSTDTKTVEEAKKAKGKTLQFFLDVLDEHLPDLGLEIDGYGDGFSPDGMIYCSWPIVESSSRKEVAIVRSSYFSDPALEVIEDMSTLPVVSARIELREEEYTNIFADLANRLSEKLGLPIPVVPYGWFIKGDLK